jgi:chromosome segregation ATPase
MTVTHEDLHRDIAGLKAEISGIQAQISARQSAGGMIRDELNESRKAIGQLFDLSREKTEKLSRLEVSLASVSVQLGTIADHCVDTGKRFEAIGADLKALQTSEARREGAQGVWAAILRSPVAAWLAGIAVAIWAFVSGHLPVKQ